VEEAERSAASNESTLSFEACLKIWRTGTCLGIPLWLFETARRI